MLVEHNGEKYCKYYEITVDGNFEEFDIPDLLKKIIPDKDKPFIEGCRKIDLTFFI
ncbi:hypothetical protein [Acetivibrio clariflavus]|uniref:hypothetical protein n=1 Tax=Acetivibrio clariflavus TaxID=288965 RepID=UPI0002E47684|nr:hypothetical protein [Acetivibrio clariflavus]HOP99543.1 hypothetical protein [Acetivibrio clariflavus]HPU41229.1 hypothetical protein [Acetivibrio clariflavus]